MRRSTAFIILTTFAAPPAIAQETEAARRIAQTPTEAWRHEALQTWPRWRGPLDTGFAPVADPPVQWSEKANVRFKTEIPGAGYGSPVVWGQRVFLTAAIPFGEPGKPVPDDAPGAHDNATIVRDHRFVALAVDTTSGEIEWQTTLHEQRPHDVFHKSSALAAASCVTDGEHVIAFFGSYGLYCLTVEGELVWKTDLGDLDIKHGHGEGASPTLFGDTLVVNWDHEGPSFTVAFDKATGEEVWRHERDEPTSWATPIVVEPTDARPQAIVSATNALRAYDLGTGDVVWSVRGLSHNVVASPVAEAGILVAGSSYEKRRMFGIRLAGARGDITPTDQVLWRRGRSTPYVPSPLLYDGRVWFLNHYQGFLACVDAKTGAEPRRPFRLGMNEIYASPVAAQNRVYVTDRYGVTLVLQATKDGPKVLARNVLGEGINASLALVGDTIYARGIRHLYAIGK